jgi:hypothetical protein
MPDEDGALETPLEADVSWIVPAAVPALRGDQPLRGIDATVADFWRFALGDLRMNNARGYFAEFIVASALGLRDARRVEWDAFDLDWEGITIEVKSSAYLQAWDQRKLSDITFSGLTATRFHPRHQYDPAGRRFNAMVYVFAVQTATAHANYDALDLDQWDLYVIGRRDLEVRSQRSIGLKAVRELAGGATAVHELAERVRNTAALERRESAEWWVRDADSGLPERP